jgi:hypothetical protein
MRGGHPRLSSSFRDAPSGAGPESISPSILAGQCIPGSMLRIAPE